MFANARRGAQQATQRAEPYGKMQKEVLSSGPLSLRRGPRKTRRARSKRIVCLAYVGHSAGECCSAIALRVSQLICAHGGIRRCYSVLCARNYRVPTGCLTLCGRLSETIHVIRNNRLPVPSILLQRA